MRADHETIDLVKRSEPDVIVVNSWYTRMAEELYNLPPHGTLNLHDSVLPKSTGFSPVLWSLISGESEIGLTIHRMNSELDAGDIRIDVGNAPERAAVGAGGDTRAGASYSSAATRA